MKIRAEMMGAVLTHAYKDGATVEASDVILETECMKMTMYVETPVSGVIKYLCQPGQMISEGDELAEVT